LTLKKYLKRPCCFQKRQSLDRLLRFWFLLQWILPFHQGSNKTFSHHRASSENNYKRVKVSNKSYSHYRQHKYWKLYLIQHLILFRSSTWSARFCSGETNKKGVGSGSLPAYLSFGMLRQFLIKSFQNQNCKKVLRHVQHVSFYLGLGNMTGTCVGSKIS